MWQIRPVRPRRSLSACGAGGAPTRCMRAWGLRLVQAPREVEIGGGGIVRNDVHHACNACLYRSTVGRTGPVCLSVTLEAGLEFFCYLFLEWEKAVGEFDRHDPDGTWEYLFRTDQSGWMSGAFRARFWKDSGRFHVLFQPYVRAFMYVCMCVCARVSGLYILLTFKRASGSRFFRSGGLCVCWIFGKPPHTLLADGLECGWK